MLSSGTLISREHCCEADLSTTSQAPSSDTRVPRAYEDQGRSKRAQRASPQGTEAPHRFLLQEVANPRVRRCVVHREQGAIRARGSSAASARTDRLRKRYEFRQVQLSGRRIHTPHFLIVVHPNHTRKHPTWDHRDEESGQRRTEEPHQARRARGLSAQPSPLS